MDGEDSAGSVLFGGVDRPHLEDPDERDVTGLEEMSPPSTVRATTIEASPVYDTDSVDTDVEHGPVRSVPISRSGLGLELGSLALGFLGATDHVRPARQVTGSPSSNDSKESIVSSTGVNTPS